MFHAVIIEKMMLKSSQSFLVVLTRQTAQNRIVSRYWAASSRPIRARCFLQYQADADRTLAPHCVWRSAGVGLKGARCFLQHQAAQYRTLAPHCVWCTPALMTLSGLDRVAGGARGAGVDDIAEHPLGVSCRCMAISSTKKIGGMISQMKMPLHIYVAMQIIRIYNGVNLSVNRRSNENQAAPVPEL